MSAATTFRYEAARADGKLERGYLEAASRDAVASMLVRRGLFAVEIEIASEEPEGRRSIPAGDLAAGLGSLASLVDAGMPISRALAALPDIAPPSWLQAITILRDRVREGHPLSQALATCPLIIPPVVIGMIRAGETSGALGDALRRASEIVQQLADTRAAIVGALIYPSVLAVAGAATVGLLVTAVIPRFAEILADLGQALPPVTRLVLNGAELLRVLSLPLALGALVTLAVWRSWIATEHGRQRWHQLLLIFPLIGRMRHAAASAAVCSSLGSLLNTGVPVDPALGAAADASGDAAIRARMLSAREQVARGVSLSRALAHAEAVTPLACRLTRAGEESGTVPGMLERAARIESTRAERMIKGAVRLLEPGMVLIFGGIIALVAAALLQAVYSVRPAP